MQSELLREQRLVPGASDAALLATYNALRGARLEAFHSRAAAEVAVRMAILAAQNAAGHLGIQPNAQPVAMTADELRDNPYQEGTMSHALHAAAAVAPKPLKTPKPRVAKKVASVRATGTGTTRPQAKSLRALVLADVAAAPDKTMTVAEICAKHGDVRGQIQKLIAGGHLVVVEG